MFKGIGSQIIFFNMSMPMDTAFQSAAEQGRRPLSRAELNRVLSARSARAFPYKDYGRKVYKRGTPAGLAQYGSSYRSATAQQKQQRVMDGIIGSGAYGFASAGRSLGARVGRYLGNKMGRTGLGDLGLAGQRLGQFAGGMAGSALGARIIGSGAYQTNSLFKGGMGVPSFASAGDETGALHVVHTEYVQDVLGTSAFTNTEYPINPGDPALFPWLSQIACNYDEYEFSGLVFTYRSVTSDLSTTSSQIGTVIMVTNYNAGSAPFNTKQSMMEYDGCARVKISEDLMSGVECDKSKVALSNHLYVAQNGTVPPGEDLKTYYHGLFQIATNQCISTGQIGELWVSYKVTLRKPKLAVTIGTQIPTTDLRLVGIASGTTLTVTQQFNNIEDVNYQAVSPIVSSQLGSSNQVVGNSSIAFATVRWSGDQAAQVSPMRLLIGWQPFIFSGVTLVHAGTSYPNCSIVGATYVFPPWVQSGTYNVSALLNGFSATVAATIIGVGVQPYARSSSGVAINSTSMAPLAAQSVNSAQLDYTITLSQSASGSGNLQYVAIGYFVPGNAGVGAPTLSFSANDIYRYSLSSVNPAAAAVNATL